MKKSLFALLFILSILMPLLSKADGGRYVEVIVSDTVELKALHFTYEITIGASADVPAYMHNYTDTMNKDSALNAVKSQLSRANFKFRIDDKNIFTKTKETAQPMALLVDAGSKEELAKLYDIIKPMYGVYGNIESVEYEPAEPYYAEMYKRLYVRAKEQADIIAKTGGSHVTKLASVTEYSEKEDYYQEMMKEFKKTPLLGEFFGTDNKMTEQYVRKFVYRFEIE